MPYANISAVLSDEERDAIITSLNAVNAKLPFTINLTNDEKSTMLKMGDKSIPFVDKSLGYAQANANLVPPYLNVAELKKDVELVRQLDPVYRLIMQLASAIDDTYTALGSEAFTASLTFYNTVRDAAKRNVPGAAAIYEDLKERFPGKSQKVKTAQSATKG